MMSRRAIVMAVLLLFLLLVGPVVYTNLRSEPGGYFVGPSLAETRYEEITFENAEAGLELGGLLFWPQGEGPFPAVVVIHGSGTSIRDNPWYLSFVTGLQADGIAVLLPDKRGSEQSGGDWRTASFEALATDTAAAVEYLAARHGDRVSSIGLWGASQGGHIAPIVAAESERVDFVVNLVGSAVPMHEQLYYEEVHNLRQMGLLPGVRQAVAQLSTRYIRHVGQAEFWDAIGNADSLPYWRQVDVPTLVLYGAEDTNVPSQRSAERLRGLDKPNITVRVYEGSGHAMAEPEPDADGGHAFRSDALEEARNFIHEAAGTR